MGAARKEYGIALSLTNMALRDPVEAISDRTFLAVMLLGMYEQLTCSRLLEMTSWVAHVRGATELIRLRGEEQFQTLAGVRMFLQFRFEIMISCLGADEAVPHPILYWAARVEEMQASEEYPANRLMDIGAEFAALKASIRLQTVTDRDEILTELFHLDDRLEAWSENLARGWDYLRMTTEEDNKNIYARKYDIYPSPRIAIVRNISRSIRLLLNRTLRKFLCMGITLSSSHAMLDQRCQKILCRMSNEICASVPFLFGQSNGLRSGGMDPWLSSTPPPAVGGGSSLIWPLHVVMGIEANPPEMITWITTRLEFIGRVMGIKLAMSLVESGKTNGRDKQVGVLRSLLCDKKKQCTIHVSPLEARSENNMLYDARGYM